MSREISPLIIYFSFAYISLSGFPSLLDAAPPPVTPPDFTTSGGPPVVRRRERCQRTPSPKVTERRPPRCSKNGSGGLATGCPSRSAPQAPQLLLRPCGLTGPRPSSFLPALNRQKALKHFYVHCAEIALRFASQALRFPPLRSTPAGGGKPAALQRR